MSWSPRSSSSRSRSAPADVRAMRRLPLSPAHDERARADCLGALCRELRCQIGGALAACCRSGAVRFPDMPR
jgi:hypothetical protein